MRNTTYRIDVACADLGEYDGAFLADCAAAVARVLREVGVVGFAVGTSRLRPEETTDGR